jgi:hypothetical protein
LLKPLKTYIVFIGTTIGALVGHEILKRFQSG